MALLLGPAVSVFSAGQSIAVVSVVLVLCLPVCCLKDCSIF